jgi:hypothetical protein
MSNSAEALLQRGLEGETILSLDLEYRYCLWRKWSKERSNYALFIGLNPSTADATEDDPTIRRCVGFAQRWGFDALCMVNLFAFRSTDPTRLYTARDPVGPLNDQFITKSARHAGRVVAAWGNRGGFMERDQLVARLVPLMSRLGVTKGGFPRHPLYVPYDARPGRYAARG